MYHHGHFAAAEDKLRARLAGHGGIGIPCLFELELIDGLAKFRHESLHKFDFLIPIVTDYLH